jgi:hypothetical protein
MADLEKFAEEIWIADGPPVYNLGVPLPTRMIIIRLGNGSLWVNSPVSLDPDKRRQIEALGPVRYLIAPTKLHIWRLAEWHQLFPEAELWAPPQIPKQFRDWPFRGVLGQASPAQWAEDLDQLVFQGNCLVQEVYFLHRHSRTAVLNDFVQNHPYEKGKPILNILWKLAGVASPLGGVPLDIRMSFVDRKAARQSLEHLLSWDFERLIIAHGVCADKDARRVVQQAFHWLARN